MGIIIQKLASTEFNGRAFKSEAGRKAADYIAAQYREIGLKPAAGSASFLQPIPGGGQNVVGLVEGRGNEFVIVAAHYDGFGDSFAGAMDNAAGVAAMLEIARTLVKNPPHRSLIFVAFDGGEQQDAGAKFYAEHPLVPLEKTAAAISLSGFGGGMSERLHEALYVMGTEFSPQLRDAVTKHKRSAAHLALLGGDVVRWPGGEHFNFRLKRVPAVTVTNGVHYAYHSKADTPNRVNYAALEKHSAALTSVIAEIADTPGKIERTAEPRYDADEAMEWHRLLTALRENVLKTPDNNPGQAQIDDVLMELSRFKGRAVVEAKAREATVLRAANLCFYIANPNGVEYNALLNRARNHEQAGQRAEAIAAYQRLLKFIEEEYRHDDQTTADIRAYLSKLTAR